jgi:hypothetical protein
MYGNFELLRTSILVICFWSFVAYILETRKIGTSFSDVALETLIGWAVFATLLSLILFMATSSHSNTLKERKRRITHKVEEDGMTFTVGGHMKHDDVLPKKYQIESKSLAVYEETTPQKALIDDALNKSLSVVKDLLVDLERKKFNQDDQVEENSIFTKAEGDGKDIYSEEAKKVNEAIHTPVSSIKEVKGFVSQSKEEIEREANKDFVPPKKLTDEEESRAINKGVLFHKTQFNALFSFIINNEIFVLDESIRLGKTIIVNKYPKNPDDDVFKGKRIFTKNQYEKKLERMMEKREILKANIEDALSKVLNVLPEFKYKGIETTTPKIKNQKELDLSEYQLVIFTALFPYAPWMVIRSNKALNLLNENLIDKLTKEEIDQLGKSEVGLSLRDKRILFNAARMYNIYVKRDKELKNHGVSSYNMPFAYNEKGEKVNTLEEAVALCELLRKALTVEQVEVQPVAQSRNAESKEKGGNNKKYTYTDNDLITIMSKLLHEKDRFNTTNTDERIGGVKNDLIYIDYDAFAPKFNGMFSRLHPKHANAQDYQVAQKALYERLKSMNLLAMRMKKASEHVEVFDFFKDGELVEVFWDYGKNMTGTNVKNTLIIHAAQMFRDIVPMVQENHGIPKVVGVSTERAIPLSVYAKKVKAIIEQRKIDAEKAKLATEANFQERKRMMEEHANNENDAKSQEYTTDSEDDQKATNDQQQPTESQQAQDEENKAKLENDLKNLTISTSTTSNNSHSAATGESSTAPNDAPTAPTAPQTATDAPTAPTAPQTATDAPTAPTDANDESTEDESKKIDPEQERALNETKRIAAEVAERFQISMKSMNLTKINRKTPVEEIHNGVEIQDARDFIDESVKVLKMRLDSKHSILEVNKDKDARRTSRKYNYYIKKGKGKEALLTYSRSDVNKYAETLDITFIKLMMNARSSEYKVNDIFKPTKKHGVYEIKHNAVPIIFNVYEQLALYQKQGTKGLFNVHEKEFKTHIKNKDAVYDVINTIEFVRFQDSEENSTYKEMAENLWNEKRAEKLFEDFLVQIERKKPEFKREGIKYDTASGSEIYWIPKSKIGLFNRMSLEVNSFLGYVDQHQKKGTLKPELLKFNERLFCGVDQETQISYIFFRPKG